MRGILGCTTIRADRLRTRRRGDAADRLALSPRRTPHAGRRFRRRSRGARRRARVRVRLVTARTWSSRRSSGAGTSRVRAHRRALPVRPFAHLTGGRIGFVLPCRTAAHSTWPCGSTPPPQGCSSWGAPEALEAVRAEVTAADGVREAVVGMLLSSRSAARRCWTGSRTRASSSRTAPTATPPRRSGARWAGGVRSLFRIQAFPGRDAPAVPPRGAVSRSLSKELRHRLRRAAVEFKANSPPPHAHTVLGDLLAEQGASCHQAAHPGRDDLRAAHARDRFLRHECALNARADRDAAAFVLLGIVLLTLATVITLVVVRWLTGSR